MDTPNTANLLGALALGLADQMRNAAEAATGHGGEAPSALAALGPDPGMSNDGLRRILKLSHPGTVRLVDKLAAGALVERRSALDGRAVALYLTEAGEKCRQALLRDRAAVLQPLIERLDLAEQATLSTLLIKLLPSLPADIAEAHNICRMCDMDACKICPFDGAS
jgi:DNA-binding MarR family transcriptional regulator